MGTIFNYNTDINKTTYLNWRTDQHQLLQDMSVMADGYANAAIIMIDACLTDNHDKKADVVIFPILFSVNHAIELYLKEINWALNILCGKDIHDNNGGHDIRQIWSVVRKQVNLFENDSARKGQFTEFTKELVSYIDELYSYIDSGNDEHTKMKNMDFSRYPFNTDKELHFYIKSLGNVVVDLEELKKTFASISRNLRLIAGDYEEKAVLSPI